MQNLSSILLDIEVTLSLLTNFSLPEKFLMEVCVAKKEVSRLMATADLNAQGSLCNNPFIIY